MFGHWVIPKFVFYLGVSWWFSSCFFPYMCELWTFPLTQTCFSSTKKQQGWVYNFQMLVSYHHMHRHTMYSFGIVYSLCMVGGFRGKEHFGNFVTFIANVNVEVNLFWMLFMAPYFHFHFLTCSSLNRVLEPCILMEMTLSDGSISTFEVSSGSVPLSVARVNQDCCGCLTTSC